MPTSDEYFSFLSQLYEGKIYYYDEKFFNSFNTKQLMKQVYKTFKLEISELDSQKFVKNIKSSIDPTYNNLNVSFNDNDKLTKCQAKRMHTDNLQCNRRRQKNASVCAIHKKSHRVFYRNENQFSDHGSFDSFRDFILSRQMYLPFTLNLLFDFNFKPLTTHIDYTTILNYMNLIADKHKKYAAIGFVEFKDDTVKYRNIIVDPDTDLFCDFMILYFDSGHVSSCVITNIFVHRDMTNYTDSKQTDYIQLIKNKRNVFIVYSTDAHIQYLLNSTTNNMNKLASTIKECIEKSYAQYYLDSNSEVLVFFEATVKISHVYYSENNEHILHLFMILDILNQRCPSFKYYLSPRHNFILQLFAQQCRSCSARYVRQTQSTQLTLYIQKIELENLFSFLG